MFGTHLGKTPMSWRTVCQLPATSNGLLSRIERSRLIQRCPFGTFAGVVVSLVPRFRTRPLTLRYQAEKTTQPLPGLPLWRSDR